MNRICQRKLRSKFIVFVRCGAPFWCVSKLASTNVQRHIWHCAKYHVGGQNQHLRLKKSFTHCSQQGQFGQRIRGVVCSKTGGIWRNMVAKISFWVARSYLTKMPINQLQKSFSTKAPTVPTVALSVPLLRQYQILLFGSAHGEERSKPRESSKSSLSS